MGRMLAIVAIAASLFAGAVVYALSLPPRPLGYAGITFARMTRAAAARTPMLAKGAYVQDVDKDSPAAKAGITPGDVVAAIDGVALTSARQAADRIGRYRAGRSAVLTVYDTAKGGLRPLRIAIVLAPPPDPEKTGHYLVGAPRALAREAFAQPPAAANAAWSKRIALGATTRPQELAGLGAGHCNGFAPEGWRVAGHAPDESMFHVMAPDRFAHAVWQREALDGRAPDAVVSLALAKLFGAPERLTPAAARPFGFTLRHFGNDKGGVGFVVYGVGGGHVEMWIVAVAAGEAAWAEPQAGAVVFSLNCAPGSRPRDPALAATAVSLDCSNGGRCQDSDFAATYLKTLKLGYVHDLTGRTYLVQPKRDYWIDGAEGPGFYHQTGGENEKLEPGRPN